MSNQINLRELALERPERSQSRLPRRRQPWLSRYIIPAGVLFGFVALLGWAARDQFASRRAVTVVPVVVTRAEIQQEGTPLFQAAGWIEPRPTPLNVAALTEGVVEKLLVVEGESVRANEPIARLVEIDAKLTLKEAESVLLLREAELGSANAELKAAKLRVDFPVHLEAQLADAESLLAKTRTELAKLPFLIESTQARLEYFQSNFEGKKTAGAGVSGRSLQLAESDYAAAQADLKELQQRKPSLQSEEIALQKKQEAVAQQLKLLIEESRQLETAAARQLASRSMRDQAQLAVEKAQLNLERTVIRSPIDGRVMQLVAHPGTRVMGLDSNASRSSSTVITMYDPSQLQVRADVRLEDVPMVLPGQPVEVQTASSKELISGTVLRSTSSANIQKNTLEVKITLENPPANVRPEMLVTATFLAPPQPDANPADSQDAQRLLIPRQLVETTDGSSSVWIVDSQGLSQRRSVELGKAGTEELVEVRQGLAPTDKLISGGREGLESGTPLEVTGEDASIGISNH